MTDQPRKKAGYKPQKSLALYTDAELICALNNCDLIEPSRLGPLCAQILKRVNNEKPLFQEKRPINHRGPIC